MRTILLVFCVFVLAPVLVDAKTMYVREYTACANNGDGTAYACASGAGAAGAFRGLANVAWGAGANQVSNGDTLYVCGFHSGGQDGAVTESSLTPTTNATIDGACPSDAGSILSANHVYTSGWTGPDAYGAYSISSGGCSNMHMAQLVAGVPTRLPYVKSGVPDATWAAGSFYDDCAGTKYVKPLGGVSANSATLYSTWIGAFTLTNVSVTIRNLTIYGLSSSACIIVDNADGSTITGNVIKWCADYAVKVVNASDRLTISSNTISESSNGVYFIATDTATSSSDALIELNTISSLNQDGYYDTSSSADGHGIGLQGGQRNIFRFNTFAALGGTCITVYDYAAQVLKDTSIYSNICHDVHETTSLGRWQLGIEYGNINTGHVANDVAGNKIYGNLIYDIGDACISTKSVLPSVGLPWIINSNTLVSCGTGFRFKDDTDGNSGFIFNNNILYNATTNIDHTQNGADTLTGITINSNAYYPDGATSFEWNGTKSAFAAWKTNSSQDAASSLTDPAFLSSTDYRLPSGSAFRRAGAQQWPCLDVRGRPCWVAPDLGAYQSTSGDPANTRAVRN